MPSTKRPGLCLRYVCDNNSRLSGMCGGGSLYDMVISSKYFLYSVILCLIVALHSAKMGFSFLVSSRWGVGGRGGDKYLRPMTSNDKVS